MAAFATRALRLDFFLPGCCGRKHLYTGATTLSEVRGELPGRSARGRSVACESQHFGAMEELDVAYQSLWKWFFWICWLCLIAIAAVVYERSVRRSSVRLSKVVGVPWMADL